jgi:hypothetical protein
MKTQKMYGKENHSFDPCEEAKLLLNQEVRVTFAKSQFWNCTGRVRNIMADGRTLEIDLDWDGKTVLLDVTFVSEIQERTQFAKTEQSLGPIANSVVQDTI